MKDHMIFQKKYDDITEYCPCCNEITTRTIYVTLDDGQKVPLRDLIPADKFDAALAYLKRIGAV